MIKNLSDVVDAGLCVGCGLCASCYGNELIDMHNQSNNGQRPHFFSKYYEYYLNDTHGLALCPGYKQINDFDQNNEELNYNPLFGHYLEIWEGYAEDKEIQNKGSSGGIITALSLFCLEKKKFENVLHTAKDEDLPWRNKTVISRNKEELLRRCGSRYAPSSPCEGISTFQNNNKNVFIGKPCDCAGVRNWERVIQDEQKFGLVVGFFCAGVPSEKGSLEYISKTGFEPNDIDDNIYRSDGWPGEYSLSAKGSKVFETSYIESWSYLQQYRHFRCQLCPDGLSEQSDISTGDAWHRLDENPESKGISVIIVRTEKGRKILHEAISSGYITCHPSSPFNVIKGQGLTQRKKSIWGRINTLKLLGVPYPIYKKFGLFRCWMKLSFVDKVKSFLGTMRRVFKRKFFMRKSINLE